MKGVGEKDIHSLHFCMPPPQCGRWDLWIRHMGFRAFTLPEPRKPQYSLALWEKGTRSSNGNQCFREKDVGAGAECSLTETHAGCQECKLRGLMFCPSLTLSPCSFIGPLTRDRKEILLGTLGFVKPYFCSLILRRLMSLESWDIRGLSFTQKLIKHFFRAPFLSVQQG